MGERRNTLPFKPLHLLLLVPAPCFPARLPSTCRRLIFRAFLSIPPSSRPPLPLHSGICRPHSGGGATLRCCSRDPPLCVCVSAVGRARERVTEGCCSAERTPAAARWRNGLPGFPQKKMGWGGSAGGFLLIACTFPSSSSSIKARPPSHFQVCSSPHRLLLYAAPPPLHRHSFHQIDVRQPAREKMPGRSRPLYISQVCVCVCALCEYIQRYISDTFSAKYPDISVCGGPDETQQQPQCQRPAPLAGRLFA